MTAASILPPDSDLYRVLRQAATERRCVFFAGLPGVGKSLLLQQLAILANEAGRTASLLQWDVARGPFETPDLLARYPETDGVTHAVIRKAAGLWARGAFVAWDAQHPAPRSILIGEVPLIGNRLIELVQRQDDASEPLLAGSGTLFLIPVPSREVRRQIEAARVREMADPAHERERANAVPSLVQALWEEVATVARALGVKPTDRSAPPIEGFDPDLYAGVYEALLRHRHAARLPVTTVLPVRGSVYDALDHAADLVPGPEDVARVMGAVAARPVAEVEREVADWFRLP